MASWDNWISNMTTSGVNWDDRYTTYTVARRCAICTRMDGTMEFSPGSVIQKADFWICPDCCRKIGEVIRNIV